MASNTKKDEIKIFRYYEGLCSSDDFPKELAKVLALGVQQDAVTDSDGSIVVNASVIRSKNWDIVYPAPDSSFDETHMTPDEYKSKIEEQVNKINDTVILKTTTTAKEESNLRDQFAVDSEEADVIQHGRTMYLEIYKPTYIADPENYPLDCERQGVTPRVVTKDMWIEKFKNHVGVEEILNDQFDTARIKDSNNGQAQIDRNSIEYDQVGDNSSVIGITQDECYRYVNELSRVTNSSYSIPNGQNATSTTSVMIDTGMLAKIKQDSPSLYNLILSNFQSEPYNSILRINVVFSVNTVATASALATYTIQMTARLNRITYTVKKGTTITLKHTPVGSFIPELFIESAYIPIDTDYYTTYLSGAGVATVTFNENFTFERSTDGILVIRYEYKVDGEKIITSRDTLKNNHYVLMRLFDNLNEEGTGPAENIYNTEGVVIQTNSHASPWSKLSWYMDFEEVMLDTIDADTPINTVADGSVFLPLETPGLTGDTKLQYWINTNNDRFSLIVMGNASLDYSRDRHLISSCYCGAIDSFEGSVLDISGNFALFTSSSTEPCMTLLESEKTYVNQSTFSYGPTDFEAERAAGDLADDYNMFINNISYRTMAVPGQLEYIITLPESNQFFKTDDWPNYMFIDKMTGLPLTPLRPAATRMFTMESGKSNLLTITITATDFQQNFTGAEILVNFGYYAEKYVTISGVSRDAFGNVVNVQKENSYGRNTSDGVTSISMYHSRSKAYYQKHHMLFATTEEYMSKVMYGKSRYTGEYYADRIKVTHGNDGPRGTLSDLLVIDSASLYPLDELVINKEFEKDPNENEETFVYFPITAPYSPLSDSPNARYGLAIKKEEAEPPIGDEDDLIAKVIQYLTMIAENQWTPTEVDITPLEIVSKVRDKNNRTADIYWKVPPYSSTEYNPATGLYDSLGQDYKAVRIAVINGPEYRGDLTDPIAASTDFEIIAGQGAYANGKVGVILAADAAGSVYNGHLLPSNDEYLGYGIASEKDEIVIRALANSLGNDAQLMVKVNDQYQGPLYIQNEDFIYNIEGMSFTEDIAGPEETFNVENQFEIYDAKPGDYLVLYKYEKTNAGKYPILAYGIKRLTREILRYPINFSIVIGSGEGLVAIDRGILGNMGGSYGQFGQYASDNNYFYNCNPGFIVLAKAGWKISSIIVDCDDYEAKTAAATANTNNGRNIQIWDHNTDDLKENSGIQATKSAPQQSSSIYQTYFPDYVQMYEFDLGTASVAFGAKNDVMITVDFEKDTSTPSEP